jgi:hypothetical protein
MNGFRSGIRDGWKVQGKSVLNLDGYADRGIANTLGYTAGRAAADLRDDSSRRMYWLANHPLAVTSVAGNAAGEVAGLSTTQKAAAAAALSIGIAPILSGNLDITNLDEWGRPKGYSAVFPDYEDPTKSTNPVGELGARYFLGRRGDVLPYTEFVKERPDVTPERYAKYKQETGWRSDSLFGLEDNRGLGAALGALAGAGIGAVTKSGIAPTIRNALGGLALGASAPEIASLGILKGGMEGLDGQPYLQSFGYNLPLTSVLGTAAAAAGIAYGLPRLMKTPVQPELFNTGAYKGDAGIPRAAFTGLR